MLLWELGAHIRNAVDDARRDSQIILKDHLYVRRKITEFKYGPEGGIGMTSHFENLVKKEWDVSSRYSFVEEIVKQHDLSTQCLNRIAKDFPEESNQSKYQLMSFCQHVAERAYDGLKNEELAECVSTFITDLSDGPMAIRVKAELQGVWLDDDSDLTLASGAIRKPNISDLESERPFEHLIGGSLPSLVLPSAILEFECRAVSGLEAQKKVEEHLGALRLFGLGSVQCPRYRMVPTSIVRGGGTIGSPNRPLVYRYGMSAADQSLLKEFCSTIQPLLPNPFQSAKELIPAHIAYHRFSDALFHSGEPEARITAAITSLEALFLKGQERSELANRLGLRVASLLRLFDFSPLRVQNEVQEAYGVRSAYIRGAAEEGKSPEFIGKLCKSVLDYARFGVVIFLQLKQVVAKNEIIGKLDSALLEPKALERLRELVQGLVTPKGLI